ncbi:hypothetical protein Pfo_013056 [Paulownia fortunei]|nr:hypothetical protein Pfo_013056 [Paulownia fortunei]
MGNIASRFSISPIKERFKNWKNSIIMWTRVDNKAGALRGLIKYKSDQNVEKDESTPIFPPEIIVEILSWLPLKYLTQVQLVCKEWRAFIHDHYFIEKQMGHSAVVWHWHNVVRSRDDLPYKPESYSFSYIHGCDGLLLLRRNSSLKYCLWNPATRLVLELPDPHDGNYGFAFSFVPATRNYRIVSIYEDKESGGEGCEVFTPGHSQAWRSLSFPDIVNSNGHREKERVSVVSAGGAVHCVLVIKVGKEIVVEIVSLDMETESFTVNHLPKLGLFHDLRTVWDLEWDAKLVFADIVGQNLQVMELEDYKKQKWCEKKKVIPLPFMEKNEGNVFPLFAKQGDIWFWLKDEKIFIYKIQTGQVADIKQSEAFSLATKLYPYKPSLITFEGMLPDTKLQKLRPRLGFD